MSIDGNPLNSFVYMSTMNKQTDLVQLQKTMMEYEKQTQRVEMTEEMMQDMFEDDEVDEEADDILSKVVDEVCLDNYQKMPSVAQKIYLILLKLQHLKLKMKN
ncbi:hypothetical protein ACTFIZ_003800 [Dictyostelium cf. discoideum]